MRTSVVVDFVDFRAEIDTSSGRIGWMSDWAYLWSTLVPRGLVTTTCYGPATFNHTDYLWADRDALESWKSAPSIGTRFGLDEVRGEL